METHPACAVGGLLSGEEESFVHIEITIIIIFTSARNSPRHNGQIKHIILIRNQRHTEQTEILYYLLNLQKGLVSRILCGELPAFCWEDRQIHTETIERANSMGGSVTHIGRL